MRFGKNCDGSFASKYTTAKFPIGVARGARNSPALTKLVLEPGAGRSATDDLLERLDLCRGIIWVEPVEDDLDVISHVEDIEHQRREREELADTLDGFHREPGFNEVVLQKGQQSFTIKLKKED